jgi:ribosomal protein S18 acetylase RimI-like enzyme
MYQLRRYVDLAPAERERLFQFTFRHDPDRFPDAHYQERAYTSAAFEHGESQFSAWEGDTVRGTMGAVVREASLRGEVFFTAVALDPGHDAAFPLLLARALAVTPTVDGLVVRMGIHPSHAHVETLAMASGFAMDYEGLIMNSAPEPLALERHPDFRVETVTHENCEPYRHVLDDAFRHSPNGATVDAEQIAELMAEIASPDLLGIAWLGDEPAAAYELDVQGDVGWIEAIAVARPMQGRGVGKQMLAAAVDRLRAHNVKEIKLLVMSTNTPAVELYARNGFAREKIASRWWRLSKIPTI